ncbi:MAG: sulfatase [Pseudomonadota bacterium]
MWKKALIGMSVFMLILALTVWFNRTAFFMFVISNTGKTDVAPNAPIEWQAGPIAPVGSGSDRPPNIVFILADDLGINDISTFGGGVAGGKVPTPNIDRLAASGATFINAYAGAATCAPSRAMLMTGRYPTRTGQEFTPAPNSMARVVARVTDNDQVEFGLPPLRPNPAHDEADIPFVEKGLPGEEVTVAEVLKPAGYHTVHIGKWHLGRSEPSRAVSQGFDESLMMASGLFLKEDDPEAVNAKLDFDPLDKFLWARMQHAVDFDQAGGALTEEWFEPNGYLTDYFTDEALNVIEANRNRPFFLYLAHWGPHTPLQTTREDYDAVGELEPHRLRVYAGMVRAVDRSVGRVLDKLEQEGIAENTIVVFSSDNGGAGYIGLSDLNQPYRGWKSSFFEGGIRVPFFVKWPDRIAPGAVISEPVSHIDLMPTLTAVAGVDLPSGVAIDGQNILPLAVGEAAAVQRPDDAIYWSSGFYKAVRAGDWKLQIDERQNKQWLFNLAQDPTERVELSATQPEKLAELKNLIDQHWQDARSPLFPHAMEWPVRIDKTNTDPFDVSDEYVTWAN